jgi:PAS domain S-box-containing protein
VSRSETATNAAPPTTLKPSGRETEFLPRALRILRLSHLPGKARAWAQPVTYLGVAMLAAIYGVVAFLIVSDRIEAEADAKKQGENLVRIIDQAYSHIFQSVDSSLLFYRQAYRKDPARFDFSSWAQDTPAKNEVTFNFGIVDAHGRVVGATRSAGTVAMSAPVGADLSDRDYFQRQKNSPVDDLLFSAPQKLKFSDHIAIVLTRRLTSQNGTFAGIVAALVNPVELGNAAAGLELGPQGAFGLVGLDGTMYTRVIDGKTDLNVSGLQFGPTDGVLPHAVRARSGNFWNTPGLVDNVSRLISYRVLDSFPVIATVAVTEAEIFRHTNEEAAVYWSIAFLLTIAILIAIKWGAVRERKLNDAIAEMKRAQEETRRSQDRYQLVEEAVNDGVWDRNLLTDQVYRSPRWKNIVGYADDEISDHPSMFFEMTHPDDRAAMAEAIRAHLEEDRPYNLDVRIRHKDGSYRWVRSRGNAIRDSEGRPVRMLGTVTDITEHKHAEAISRENHANLARAEALIGMGHFKFEPKAGTYTWSDGLYRIVGKARDSFTPTPENALQFLHPEDRPTLEKYRHDVMAGIDTPPVTVRALTDNRGLIDVEIWAAPTLAKDGSITGMFGTARDVTARNRAEAAINESRENLARAEAMALLGHTRTGCDGTYTWSAGVYRMMGKSPQDYTPTPDSARELIHPDDRAAHDKYRRDAMAGIEVPRKTVRMIRDDGQTIDVEFWSVPIRDKDGLVIGKFSTLQDITALKRTEALISESHANLERAERMALLGHYKIDRGTGNLVWSNGIYRIYGLSPETFTPTLRSVLELVHPDDRHLLKKCRDDAMAGQEIPHVTMHAFRGDGQPIDIEYWSTPVRDDNGVITGVFGTVQDITIRKRAEETLARANQELEARVSERTAELAREMRRREEAQMTLGQMQKMEAVGQLTAGIAHDFNNLLAVIGGSLEFVDGAAARGLTAEPELIDAALRATRRGRELVRRLLAFSRQSPLRAEATTIDQLVLDTLRLLQRTLGQGIDMVTQLDAKAAVISVDRNQMANALLNLALNARDAMPDGGQLTIETKCQPVNTAEGSPRSPTGEEVCITISDTGVGMTDDVRSRAFEPFFTTKLDGLGSGLGLSMVQGFVEQSGGKIDIQSAPGNGTIITIRLPRVASESQADEADMVAGTSVSGREKTVLLVEDDADVRVVTAAQLRHLGYKVHAVGNGMEAIDLIASPANIDITLTDIVLPGGLDGVALVKEAMRARPNMGVLCMSGYNPTEKHRKWLKVQNINFLEKPFSSGRLAQALDAALAH